MNNRPAIGQLIAISIVNLVILFITFSLVSNGTANPQLNPTITTSPTWIPQIEVVIAVQNIPRGVEITPAHVTVVVFPIEFVPMGAFSELEFVIGKIATTDIYREELILARKLVESLDSLGRVGSDITAILRPGEVAMTIYIPAENVVSGLQSGDRFDLIYTVPDASILISDVLLVWIGDVPERVFAPLPTVTPNLIFREEQSSFPTAPASFTPPDIDENIMLTIAISRQDAVTIDWAINEDLPVRVIARSVRAQGLAPIVPVNADNVLELYSQATFTPTPTVDSPATDMALLRSANATVTSLAATNIAFSTQSPQNMETQSAIATDLMIQRTLNPGNPIPKGISAVYMTATALAEMLSEAVTPTATP